MKIAFCHVHTEDWERKYITSKLKGHKVSFFDTPITEDNAAKFKDYDILGVFVWSKINRKAVSKFKKVKFITTMSTGYDHIDLKACRDKGIAVAYVPSYGENTVAEHAMALLLAISRKIIESVERTRKGNFDLEGLRGFDLKGKTIGVIGTGNIGKHVCTYAKGFDMKILANDKYPNKEFAAKLGFRYVSIPELLKKSDIISLHVPLLPSTKHMINKARVNQMKKGMVVINTARGSLVDTTAILMGLKSGKIAWYAADVLEEECAIKDERERLYQTFEKGCDLQVLLEDHMLLYHPNVLITPHNAFNSWEALKRIYDTTVENIRGFVKKKPVNLVK
ncbi:hydroxyacid dehydrogenase [Candidatus Woesearchaeota archaeon]|nr:hydroxyacid dehydrogenase [Candidatus Woesearchaeota archaeon]